MKSDLRGSLVPASEAARHLRMSRERVVRMVQSGALAGQQIAGRWLVAGAALPGRDGRDRDDAA